MIDAEADIVGINGNGQGWTQLAFNTYDKDIDGGGASTTAVRDPKFRDALGYAIDGQELVDQVLSGYGLPGTTVVPPFLSQFHIDPATPRTFDLDEAKRRLDAAGYLDANGNGTREDKEGKEISLRIYHPDDRREIRQGGPIRGRLVATDRHPGDDPGLRSDTLT